MNDEPTTVLVVDDEPSVLGVTSMLLQRSGYTVLTANSGKEALAVLEGQADVAVALVDCDMPGISGPELDEMILARWSYIKVIAMSGRPRSSKLPDAVKFIHKPFRGTNLIAVIESALGREAAKSHMGLQ